MPLPRTTGRGKEGGGIVTLDMDGVMDPTMQIFIKYIYIYIKKF